MPRGQGALTGRGLLATVRAMRFADADTVRQANGLRLITVAGVPSPWSQAAVAIVDHKGIEAVAYARGPKDAAVTDWAKVANAPAALFNDEPARSGWAEILMLAERLQPEPSLIPTDGSQRALMFGLSHELMSEGGLIWNARLATVHASLLSEGKQGYIVPIAKYLAARYGYDPARAEGLRALMKQSLQTLDKQLQASEGPYYFGGQLTALDFYSSAALDILVPLPEADCAMHPKTRLAFEWMAQEILEDVPKALIAHRDMMHTRHIPLPLALWGAR